ncbi:MAG: hypothetical protein NTY80_02535 [candidate division SR1 bacterium]|nr:hypothetical protein [candidate division SR1 bacterium]
MKKIVTLLFLIGLFFGLSSAYEPTSQDIAQVKILKTQLDTITTGNMKDKWDFYAQLKTLQEQFSGYEQLNYYLNELGINLITQVNTEKVKSKATSKTAKQDFFNQWSGGFSQEITVADSCTGWYNTMDSISFANNFPTALMISTRYRETSCGFYMPNNGDGPFQILSKDYGTGQISEAKFIQTMQDFIDFSKAKYLQYKTKLGISLTYTGYSWTGLIYHAALYNGGIITGNTTSGYVATPINPRYAFDGYGQEYSGAVKYGILPKFLKVLDRELKTNY